MRLIFSDDTSNFLRPAEHALQSCILTLLLKAQWEPQKEQCKNTSDHY